MNIIVFELNFYYRIFLKRQTKKILLFLAKELEANLSGNPKVKEIIDRIE